MLISSRNFGTPIDISGWRFAFNVDYGLIDVPSNTSEYQDLKKKFNHPGEYDIRRLFIDFKSEFTQIKAQIGAS